MRKIYFLLLLAFCACLTAQTNARVHSSLHKAAVATGRIQHNQIIYSGGNDTAVHHKRKHKLIAALIALPFGIFGLHRVYLGTSAAIPFLYIASAGGAFGILPFVDFVLIILCKDVNAYAHNPHIFMWSKREKKQSPRITQP